MSLAMRHRHDATPAITPLNGLVVRPEFDPEFLAELQQRPAAAISARFAAGHRAYVAWLANEPAAWGWVATKTAEIGELATQFRIPPGQRYLWNFVTHVAHRGKGVYPWLIDEIVRIESRDASVFWIAYAPENHASASGITKAGFVTVATLSFDHAGEPAIKGLTAEGAAAAAQLLGIVPTTSPVSECWRCVRAKAGAPSCRTTACCCDYQKPLVVCDDPVEVRA